MTPIPSISSSAMSALQNGFAMQDKGAAEVVDGTLPGAGTDMPQDIVDLSSASITGTEPLLAGIRDMMLAKAQEGAGALLLRTYQSNSQTLIDALRR